MEKQINSTSDRELRLERILNAPIELVWEVWTKPEHITQWWGPDGFTNTIHEMNFVPEGEWNFIMHGPDGTNFPNKNVFKEIVPYKKIVYEHVPPPNFLATIQFEAQGDKTKVEWHMLFATAELFIQVVKTYKAEEGLKQNIAKLNHYLQAQFELRNKLKLNNMARVSTYLNFPGNTEEAFIFYKSVFGGEFNGGIQRLGDAPPHDGMPVLDEETKKMILHIELPILGGHVLMATDAPESMGFKLTAGNNMHINLEPDTREETKRIFDALSVGGNITMPLQDMFWGAYFGSCTDKYGISWMLNCMTK